MPPKPPKRKKKFGRNPKNNANKKRSTYDFDSARAVLDADSINHAQIMMHASQTGPNPPAPKSPLKKQYKAMLRQKEYELVDALEENYELLEENESLRRVTEMSEKKVLHFKAENRKLAQALREEKAKSRLIINKLLDEAESVIADANEIKFNAEEKMSATELAIFNERERMKLSVQKERDYNSFQVASRKLLLFVNDNEYFLTPDLISTTRSQTKTEA
jgi:hypothetical protein